MAAVASASLDAFIITLCYLGCSFGWSWHLERHLAVELGPCELAGLGEVAAESGCLVVAHELGVVVRCVSALILTQD